jgi:hypothetical protein
VQSFSVGRRGRSSVGGACYWLGRSSPHFMTSAVSNEPRKLDPCQRDKVLKRWGFSCSFVDSLPIRIDSSEHAISSLLHWPTSLLQLLCVGCENLGSGHLSLARSLMMKTMTLGEIELSSSAHIEKASSKICYENARNVAQMCSVVPILLAASLHNSISRASCTQLPLS